MMASANHAKVSEDLTFLSRRAQLDNDTPVVPVPDRRVELRLG